jgi:hypothetical protein
MRIYRDRISHIGGGNRILTGMFCVFSAGVLALGDVNHDQVAFLSIFGQSGFKLEGA